MATTTTGELISGGGRCGPLNGFCVIFVTPGTLMQKLRDADQIVCGGGEDKEPFDQVPPSVPSLSQAADRLDLTEGLFDPLSLNHADGVARMAGRAAIDRRAAMGVVLRNIRSAAAFAQPATKRNLGRTVFSDYAAILGAPI